jgi:hypothetical protein
MQGGMKSRRRMKSRGGGNDLTPAQENQFKTSKQVSPGVYTAQGPRTQPRSLKSGGGVISTALVPFGLLGLQQLFKSRKSNKHDKRRKFANRTRRR